MTARRPGRPARRSSNPEALEAILASSSADVRALAAEVRSLVARVVPTAYEVAYPGWKAIGFRDPQSGYFLGLFPRQSHIDLVFERGAQLADPDGLFEPRRNLRQVRYVVVRSRTLVRSKALARMVERAVLAGS